MTEDALSFLDDVEQPAAVEAEAPEPEQVETEGEVEAAPPAAPESHRDVPLTALLDEREKRQQVARENEELRRRLASLEARPAEPPVDIFADPEGFARQQQAATQAAIMQDRFERSRYMAEEKHGSEAVNQVVDFFNDPQHAPKTQEFLRHPDPFGAAFRYYNEQKEISELRSVGGVSAMRERLETEIREKILAEMQSGKTKPATPPPSLSSAASAGAAKAPPVNGFDVAFGS